jgi:hypothetical protein
MYIVKILRKICINQKKCLSLANDKWNLSVYYDYYRKTTKGGKEAGCDIMKV